MRTINKGETVQLRDILNREVILTFDSSDSQSEAFAEEVGGSYDFVKVTPTGVRYEPQLKYGKGEYIRGREEIQEFLELFAKCKAPKARPKTKIDLEAFLAAMRSKVKNS